MDDSMRQALLDDVQRDVVALLTWLAQADELDLGMAEQGVRAGVLAIGGRVLEAGLAARGTGKAGPRLACACGGVATFEGYRAKGVQTLVGWVTVRRTYYACPRCGHGRCPLDASLGVSRDSHSPGVRRLATRFGALLPFAQAAATLAAAANVQLSASEAREITETIGAQREQAMTTAVAQAWNRGLPAMPEPPERLYVAMDGVLVPTTSGEAKEVKVGVVAPARRDANGETRATASYAACLGPAAQFGPRLAVEAHRRGAEGAAAIAVLGDGAAWIWHLAAEHVPHATCIVDWFHASERIWDLGRALYGAATDETTAWVATQLDRLRHGHVDRLVGDWQRLVCQGETAAVRDAQVTYFTNQAARMAYDRYRAAGWDIGSGMVESAGKHLIAAREKGPGMRWSESGANAVAQVRVALFNDHWDDCFAAA